jgi:MerR family transcriptional regulator, light-induced transcriptional regulator
MCILDRAYGVVCEYRDRMSVAVIDTMFEERPDLKKKYSHLYERLVLDVQFHFDYIAQSIRFSSKKLLEDYAIWLLVFFRDINVPLAEIEYTFRIMQEELNKYLDEESQHRVNEHFDVIYRSFRNTDEVVIDSFIEENNPLLDLATQYFNLVMHHRRQEASTLLIDAIKSGTSIKDIYLHVIQKSQQEVGRLWQTNKMSVAEEHLFTATTQLIMSQLYTYLFTGKNNGLKVLSACVGRELHELGMRFVSDFFEMEGWDSVYVGANTPTTTLLSMIKKERPDIIALSVTIMPHLKQLDEIITRARQDTSLAGIRIIVGGYPFNIEKDLWKTLKADGYAPDAQGAVEIANSLIL